MCVVALVRVCLLMQQVDESIQTVNSGCVACAERHCCEGLMSNNHWLVHVDTLPDFHRRHARSWPVTCGCCWLLRVVSTVNKLSTVSCLFLLFKDPMQLWWSVPHTLFTVCIKPTHPFVLHMHNCSLLQERSVYLLTRQYLASFRICLRSEVKSLFLNEPLADQC